ncbi:MAG: hypothetical protein SOX43_06640 [Pelistega sp.]|nr:hypothetical protein [Pelistega sp.]
MMKKLLLCIVPVLLVSACSRILYEETDIHYVERCAEQSCEKTLNKLKTQCQGEIIEAYLKGQSAIVQCRPAKPVDPKQEGTSEVKPKDAHITPNVEEAVKKEIQD